MYLSLAAKPHMNERIFQHLLLLSDLANNHKLIIITREKPPMVQQEEKEKRKIEIFQKTSITTKSIG